MVVDCDTNTTNELQQKITYMMSANENYCSLETRLWKRENNLRTRTHRQYYERSLLGNIWSAHRCWRRMSRTVDGCDAPSHRLNLQNIHRSLTCSWWKSRRPRTWNIEQSTMIHWTVVDRNESCNSSATPRAVCLSRSNIGRLDFRTLAWIEPRIDWRNMNSIPRHCFVELILKVLWTDR